LGPRRFFRVVAQPATLWRRWIGMSRPTRPAHIIAHVDIDARKLALARAFRRAPTAAEAAAWQILRDRGLFGLKFRRQQVIAGFIVDFYCASARLALELDGGVHDDPDQRAYDAARRDALASHDVRVLRLDNRDVHEQALRDLLAPYARPRPDCR
jgi:very-short-patch-repair endonuclease